MSAPAAFVNPSGDESQNKFRVVTLTFLRARQLHKGARPRIEADGHKILRIALLEVTAGMISWDIAESVADPRNQA